MAGINRPAASAVRAALAAGLVALGWISIQAARGDRLVANGSFAAAASADPMAAGPHLGLADALLRRGDAAKAEQEAKVALAKAPLSAEAVRRVALARLARGDTAGAAALLGPAAGLGWRDTGLQLLLIDAALSSGSPEVAVPRIAALARRRVQLPAMFALVDRLLADPAYRPLLVGQMIEPSEWRERYLTGLARRSTVDPALADQLILALARAGSPPSRAELRDYLQALADGGELGRARLLWTRVGGATGERGKIHDGDFRSVLPTEQAFPFEWGSRQVAGGSVSAPDSGGLEARTDGSGPGALVSQQTDLAPGPHRFEVTMRGDPNAGDALRWWIGCKPGGTLPVRRSNVRQGDAVRVRIDFVVPVSCARQEISLRAESAPTPGQIEARFEAAAIDGA